MNKQFDNAKKRQTKKILQVCILTCVWMPNIPHQSLVKVGLVTWTVSLQGTVIHVVLFRFLPTAANHLNQPNQQNPTHTADPLLYIQTPHTRTLTHRDTPKDSGRHHVSPFSFFFFLFIHSIVPHQSSTTKRGVQRNQHFWLWKRHWKLFLLPTFVESAVRRICRQAENESAGGVKSVDSLQGKEKAKSSFKVESCQ